ncbi:PREDICTED: scm-like with four MBT domains protein 2 isoform X1 [Poecilia mexicana]|uniref:scm-like with four MBT domains protein 2 isoform X1 n=1 Tax=Poecilia mexicana TaxID=48701 RepID=UPI00072E5145|nr:PREDICTED: scm-like with four MBT domains protein 2 isoform X1 [Poecilia mexicana]XP_014841322.1 PREDICTED: scm-like with four MBT domains protein 2 isoform X1 [Poecilia mexicana]XP_014841323.1 PREDICTED: scm-like with four MBT domains protein 2 isoform X1 [Poecilia mexicana]XP_014841324.1 PREDICTED: scm-like with four MBT domains protein 2 isoform X1 [Poecilia mexicana]XP_014841325.1 PREDICTED: scm-like with four MBT domains protein 2 isoform X1 [Poecilia mexicana]
MQTGAQDQPTNGKEEQVTTGAESMEEEFMWEEYLEETGGTAAPHTIFRHVEVSLQSSFQPGMKLEVASKSSPETYWVATIITTCGQLLLLRYSGYGDDRRADFWCDVMTAELHPVGWCAQNHKTLTPPEENFYLRTAIREKYSDWTEFLVQDLTGSRTAPANLLDGPLRGKNTVDLIVAGSVLELQNLSDPLLYWPVRVIQNIGGRLRLRPVGLSERHRAQDTWLFYLDVRLRPLGWALENRLTLEPPTELRPLLSDRDWQQALQDAQADGQKDAVPLEVFKDHADLPRHAFRTGMKLEMVSPWEQLLIRPVSVTKVYSDTYFQVTLDDLCAEAAPRSAVCHANSPGILPVQWCLKNGVALERPRGYEGPDFDWADYLKQSGSEAAPDACFPDTGHTRGFTEDMWLEAVNPARPEEVCVARVSRVRGRLLWLRLEGVLQPQSECIVDVESMDIFPVGWCEANSYPLTPPLRPVCQKQKKIAVVQPEKQSAPPAEAPPVVACQPVAMDTGAANGRYCCSRVFVNHRCFSGPYLNKGRIAELPRAVGPGKCSLVLKELLSMLINAAYKPGRVLKELQQLQEPGWDSQEETLKAKYKGKTYRSTVRIVRLAEQIPDFCRKVCVKLQCCPNLLGPDLRADSCPENCSVQTKTKYTYYYGKKRRLPRAVGGDEAKPARRRRKRKAIFVQKKRRSSNMDFTAAGSPQDSDEEEEEDEELMQSCSEGSSSEPRDDQTDASSVEATGGGGRPRRAAALRRAFSAAAFGSFGSGPFGAAHQPPDGRRRSTRSLSACSQNNRQQHKDVKVEEDGQLVLDRNPLEWSVDEVVQFINSTDCASLANIFKEQDIDGQALLLLTLPTVQECMDLKLGPAIKLCHQIERVKVAFYKQFA